MSLFNDTYHCQCYQIGGPFIAEDPDCPMHGINGFEYDSTDEIARLTQALEVFANPNNWRVNGICDQNGGCFIGLQLAQNALARYRGT